MRGIPNSQPKINFTKMWRAFATIISFSALGISCRWLSVLRCLFMHLVKSMWKRWKMNSDPLNRLLNCSKVMLRRCKVVGSLKQVSLDCRSRVNLSSHWSCRCVIFKAQIYGFWSRQGLTVVKESMSLTLSRKLRSWSNKLASKTINRSQSSSFKTTTAKSWHTDSSWT